ncbi:hypothetical protein MLD38_036405 [Melastoma candidum]|uniref:Uncharacterized protein n=1 Tax=Melastoma candidum TaxID=119954 RepID=A0ACB9LK63_9MYRT|nr:hypothetical protein MLD38_036405 [Melastoma candidum]
MEEGKSQGQGPEGEESTRTSSGTIPLASLKSWAVPGTVFALFFILSFSSGLVSRLDVFNFSVPSFFSATVVQSSGEPPKIPWPLNCTNGTVPQTCPANYPTGLNLNLPISGSCPEYFRWIHEDLSPWKDTGITREMLERPKAREFAHFRLIILNGKPYLETFKRAFETRDVFTIWGILQLLRLYPGKVPDLELMFCCEDRTVILKKDYPENKNVSPPPLFHYCGNTASFDVTFPDWSFWGWPEVNVKPWEETMRAIRAKANKIKWKDRQPYAHWKGNPLNYNRQQLMNCNKKGKTDWNVRASSQDWGRERQAGFKTSSLEDQCKHRYKVYVEGNAWSVSEKYIMACNSTTLMVKPDFYDFFTRGMYPLVHYWPIRPANMCKDIKFAVDWGNKHSSKAREMGEKGTRFIEESVKQEYVYDYMLHMLTEYAKLLRFKPEVPAGAREICSETMACTAQGLVKEYMLESLVGGPSESLPCKLPPPFGPDEVASIWERKENATRLVETWGDEYWKKHSK